MTGRPIRVLVVDEDAASAQRTAEELAGEEGLEPTVETDVEKARETFGDGFDCLVASGGLSESASDDLLRSVREAFGNPPVVLTCSSSDRSVEPLTSAGVAPVTRFGVDEPDPDATLASCIECAVSTARTQTRYERLLDGVSDGIATIDSEGTILSADQQLATLLEHPPGELADRSLTAVFPGELGRQLPELVREARDAEEPREVVGGHDGRLLRVLVRPIEERGGHELADLLVQDVTDRIRHERQSERLEEFASIVSHDLRNPLNVALSSVELLEADGVENENMDRLERSLSRMGDIIDDGLTLARETDAVDELSTVDLETVAKRAWSYVDADDVQLAVTGSRRISADAEKFEVLLKNLLHNPVEHGETTEQITVGTLDDGFFVADDGSGIADDRKGEVFSTGYTTSRNGTGLGLNIVDAIATIHGWEVSLSESESGGVRIDVTGIEDPDAA